MTKYFDKAALQEVLKTENYPLIDFLKYKVCIPKAFVISLLYRSDAELEEQLSKIEYGPCLVTLL